MGRWWRLLGLWWGDVVDNGGWWGKYKVVVVWWRWMVVCVGLFTTRGLIVFDLITEEMYSMVSIVVLVGLG